MSARGQVLHAVGILLRFSPGEDARRIRRLPGPLLLLLQRRNPRPSSDSQRKTGAECHHCSHLLRKLGCASADMTPSAKTTHPNRHSAECRQPPHPVLSQRHIAICRRSSSDSTTRSPPMRSPSPPTPAAHFTCRPRRHFRTASSGAPLTSQTPFSRIPTDIEILSLGRAEARRIPFRISLPFMTSTLQT